MKRAATIALLPWMIFLVLWLGACGSDNKATSSVEPTTDEFTNGHGDHCTKITQGSAIALSCVAAEK